MKQQNIPCAAIAAAEFLQTNFPDRTGFSPRNVRRMRDFYKTYAYACLYKSDTETVDLIPADELTITFVCYHYPRNMLRKLEQDRRMEVRSKIQ